MKMSFFGGRVLKAKTQRIYQKIWRIKSAPFGAEYSNRGSYTAHVLVTRREWSRMIEDIDKVYNTYEH
jgi:hypothetical protein